MLPRTIGICFRRPITSNIRASTTALKPITSRIIISNQPFIRSFSQSRLLKMQTYNTVASYRDWRHSLPREAKVGVVPTMGALHAGHIDLVRAAAAENDHVVVTIFLNPAQFSPTEDLAAYPKTLDSDLAALKSLDASLPAGSGKIEAIFVPSVGEMYPLGIPLHRDQQAGTFVEVIPLSAKLEGGTRPHFFRGVATVCSKLFNITQPTAAYFGQKDIQQTVIIRRLLADLHFPINLRVIPTTRESDGLAMSSRNVYLTGARRKVAPVLYQALQAAEEVWKSGDGNVERILGAARKIIDAHAEEGVKIKLDYISLNEPDMLEEVVGEIEKGQRVILSAALFMLPSKEGEGSVRLIDNLILE